MKNNMINNIRDKLITSKIFGFDSIKNYFDKKEEKRIEELKEKVKKDFSKEWKNNYSWNNEIYEIQERHERENIESFYNEKFNNFDERHSRLD